MGDQDMPKLQSPYKRAQVDGRYILTNQQDPYMDWFFNSKNLVAVEKLDGTNVSIVIEDSVIVRAYNRMNPIPINSNHRLWQGIKASLESDLISPYISCLPDGQFFGELIGEGVQENPMNLKGKLWIPFNTFGRDKLTYQIPNPMDFDSLEYWMKNNVRSKLFDILHPSVGISESIIPEGIVFHDLVTSQMAKLRSDMYKFWYDDPTHRPHKFKEDKVIEKKEPSKLQIGMQEHNKKRSSMSEEDWIKERNEILLKHGVNVNK